MPWGRLDDGLYDHPKLHELGRDKLAAIGLWTLAVSWCNRRLTDGHIPAGRVQMLGGTSRLAQRLVQVGLFEEAPGGYSVHDFLDFNDSAEQVLARRAAAAERQRKHREVTPDVTRESQRDEDVSHSVTGALVTAPTRAHARTRPGPTRPIPSVDTPPNPPPSGGRRANGTNPRAAAADAEALAKVEAGAKRWRRTERHQAYLRGAISGEQQQDMDRRDAPLEEIPDWSERQAARTAELEAAL